MLISMQKKIGDQDFSRVLESTYTIRFCTVLFVNKYILVSNSKALFGCRLFYSLFGPSIVHYIPVDEDTKHKLYDRE